MASWPWVPLYHASYFRSIRFVSCYSWTFVNSLLCLAHIIEQRRQPITLMNAGVINTSRACWWLWGSHSFQCVNTIPIPEHCTHNADRILTPCSHKAFVARLCKVSKGNNPSQKQSDRDTPCYIHGDFHLRAISVPNCTFPGCCGAHISALLFRVLLEMKYFIQGAKLVMKDHVALRFVHQVNLSR